MSEAFYLLTFILFEVNTTSSCKQNRKQCSNSYNKDTVCNKIKECVEMDIQRRQRKSGPDYDSTPWRKAPTSVKNKRTTNIRIVLEEKQEFKVQVCQSSFPHPSRKETEHTIILYKVTSSALKHLVMLSCKNFFFT